MGLAATARSTELRRDGDAGIVADLLRGDEHAFLRLVRREHSAMIRYAQTLVSTAAGAEEVAQEAWAGLLATLPRFEGRSSLRVWLFGIMANCAKSRVVREARSIPVSALSEENESAVDPERFFGPGSSHANRWMRPPEPWPEDSVERPETLELVRAAIERLPGLRRQVILLRDVEGWSAEEVCELLDITERNQRVLLHRARSRVRAELERHFAN
jgi:RNA polymerase sigma-70 factor, ECF subfamily